MSAPRVTVGIPTYDRDTYLAEAIASAVVFCLESDFMTGETIRVDGGRHVR